MSLHHRMRRRAGIVVLALLLLVPLVVSGHRHTTPGSDDTCAACAATHHAPLTRASGAPVFALAVVGVAARSEPSCPPTRRQRAPRGERAPPRSSATFVA